MGLDLGLDIMCQLSAQCPLPNHGQHEGILQFRLSYLGKCFNGPQCYCHPLYLVPSIWKVQFQLYHCTPQQQAHQQSQQTSSEGFGRVEHELAQNSELQNGHVHGRHLHVERHVYPERKEEVDEGRTEISHGPEEAESRY